MFKKPSNTIFSNNNKMSVSGSDLSSEKSEMKESTTIFSTLSMFPDPEKIRTQEFLDASTGFVIVVEKLGKVFAPVVYDMKENIKKISAKYEEDIENHEFLEDMILKQKKSGDLVVVDALQWLLRDLRFITQIFNFIGDDKAKREDLSSFVKNAYSETFEGSGWLGTQLFNILSRFTPTREHLFYKLALNRHNKDDHVIRDMKIFTKRMWSCVHKLLQFYDLETDDSV